MTTFPYHLPAPAPGFSTPTASTPPAPSSTQPAPSSSTPPPWSVHLPAGVDHREIDLVTDQTLARRWTRNWRDRPQVPIIHDPTTGWHTGADLERDSARVAAAYAALGLRAGDRVLFSAPASYRLVTAHVAAFRLGLIVVPANLAYRERELRHIVDDAQVGAVVIDDVTRVAWLDPDGVPVLTPDEVWDATPATTPPPLDAVGGDDPALIGYTSGTTGPPKGAVLSQANMLAGAASVALAWRWTANDRLVLCLPLFHAHGLAVGLHGTLYTGGSAVLQTQFDGDAVFDAIAEHQATMFFGVPTMYTRLAESPRAAELGPLRLCVSGSAPLSAETWNRIAERTGQPILERYGMTETLMNISNPHDRPRRPGAVGFPLPGVEVAFDREPDQDAGEILLRGPNVFAQYWNRPDATHAAFTDDGWFRTGDIGAVDADGYISIVGRAKELIITGGYNVYPLEVEEVLGRHPDIAEIAVAGTPSAEWGEVVTAYVCLREPGVFDRDGFDALAAEELAAYKRPRLVHFIDALPRNALGKIVRHELTPPPAP